MSGEPLVAQVDPPVVVVNKGRSCLAAARACCGGLISISSLRDLARYFYEHRKATLLLVVTLGMVGLLASGLIWFYEPLQLPYKDIDTPVLHGYDLVAYFSLGTWSHAARGKSSIRLDRFYNWTDPRDNHTYSYSFWFLSDANRQRFARDPWRYIPAFGGFSAYKTATEDFWQPYPDPSVRGAAPFTHPDAFVVKKEAAEGGGTRLRLFMEYSLEYKKLFMQSLDVVRMADAKWRRWYGPDGRGPLNNFAVRGRFSSQEERRDTIVTKKL